MTYDNLPFKTLVRILNDQENVEKYGVTKEEWKAIQEEYNEAYPSPKTQKLMAHFGKGIKQEITVQKYVLLLKLIKNKYKNIEEAFKSAGVRFTGNLEKDVKYLNTQINKSIQVAEIEKARLEKIKEEIEKSLEEQETQKISIPEANEEFAWLEKNGANIPDYDKFTCGQRDAWRKVVIKSAKNNGK